MYILKTPQLQVSVDNKKIVSDGSLTISEGDVVLLTGPNGCGKSTIIKLLMGDTFNYHKLDSGSTVALFHHGSSELDILSEESNMELFRRNVCYVSQDDVFESEALLDCFLMSLNYCDIENKEKYIYDFVRKFSIQDCFNIDDTLLDRKCRKLIDKLDIDADSLSASDIRAIKFHKDCFLDCKIEPPVYGSVRQSLFVYASVRRFCVPAVGSAVDFTLYREMLHGAHK